MIAYWMDPLCHTLAGITLAQAGLRHRSRLATATLVLGANLPDVDAVTYLFGDSLFWRRGWTHGVLALAVWPMALTALVLAVHRVTASRCGTTAADPPRAGVLLLLATLAVLTHPLLDFMNNYGVRVLMPFAGRWFYGDALFIVDPWVWGTLFLGTCGSWWMGRRSARARSRTRPARLALSIVCVYATSMLILGHVGRGLVQEQFEARGIALASPPMVAPLLANPIRRYVVADDGSRYHVTDFSWWPRPTLGDRERLITKEQTHPAVIRARSAPEARGFIRWARFPFFTVIDEGPEYLVTMDDARYAPAKGLSWASVIVRVPRSMAEAGIGREPEVPAVVVNKVIPDWRARVTRAFLLGCQG